MSQVKSDPALYHDLYCEVHEQWYGKHLKICPICLGEQMGEDPSVHLKKSEVKEMGDKGV